MFEFLSEFTNNHQTLLWLMTISIDLGFALILYRIFGKTGLYASIILSILMANLQGPKLTIIWLPVVGNLQTSLGVILYSGIYFATDLLSEKYGKREANRAVMAGFATSVMIVVMIFISMRFLPSTDPRTAQFSSDVHNAFATLFNFTPRFVFGSLLAYLISQRFDVWIFHFIKEHTGKKHLWIRNNLSTMSSQALDTFIYSLIVWWGIVDLAVAMQLGLAKYLFKVLIAMIDTPFIYWGRSWELHEKDWNEFNGKPV
ncbi:MAG: queuosine precursor transporter [Gammaproteobacteria bacterium]|nr:queuosine precursor transporter [Gammaproteobacteria bacterium]